MFNGYPGATDMDPKYEPVDGFDRTVNVGVVTVTNLDLVSDPKDVYPFPPAKVTDLKVIAISRADSTVTLQWTAVGDYEEQETGTCWLNRGLHFVLQFPQADYLVWCVIVKC